MNRILFIFVLFFTFISTLLGGSIAFGVIYNNMRIALSERNRELASLRVLGFHRGEVAYILLGELAPDSGRAVFMVPVTHTCPPISSTRSSTASKCSRSNSE